MAIPNYSPADACRYMEDVAEMLDAEFCRTRQGVPRIIYTYPDGEKISLVYSIRNNQWKGFFPFPAPEQTRVYFASCAEMVDKIEHGWKPERTKDYVNNAR